MMKHTRVTAASVAVALSPLAGIAASLAGALPAWSGEVPFTERVISTTASGAYSVFATDLDSDGDTDVLSASHNDDKIAWYENTTRRCEDCPADFDGDGEVRVPDLIVLLAAWGACP